jgi:hypothetical protein
MARAPRALLAALAAAALAACSGVSKVKDAPADLSASETSAVRAKAKEAEAKKDWAVAWNHEVEAGASRERLEEIALEALADEDGDAADMLREIRRKWTDLSPAGRARVDALVEQAKGKEEWERAAEIEILAANDAPEFKAAWEVYKSAPPDPALDVLAEIQKARAEHAKDAR